MELRDETIDLEELFREIAIYLTVVAEFRDAGCDVGALERPEAGDERG